MKQLITTAIILSRTDYGEADRIVTMLTPDHGKLRLMARGVRKANSKLAGGIELFSVSQVSYIKGRGEIGTLVSARLIKHYGKIVQNIDRVQLGYAIIKMLNKTTEDQPEPEYFELLEKAFASLDNSAINSELIKLWFQAQLLAQSGHMPNLISDVAGDALAKDLTYEFDIDAVAFAIKPDGHFSSDHIKTLRLLFSGNIPKTLAQVAGTDELLADLAPLITLLASTYLRI